MDIPQKVGIKIQCVQDTILMGASAEVKAVVKTAAPETPSNYILLPFINQRRWGAYERPDAAGDATFLLPIPNPGCAQVQVLALKSDTDHWLGLSETALLLAGRPMPDGGIRSNVLDLSVVRRSFSAPPQSDTLFCMQWEPWFTRGLGSWRTTQSIPLTGLYESYNRDVIRQHILWFIQLGVDFIMADWSNHIWGKVHWNERSDHVNTLLHATQLVLETLADMRDEGLPVPKMALMPGISNGPPCTMAALNEQLDWIYHAYLRNLRFEGLWQEFEGKPLIIILDTGAVGHPKGTAESAFRVPFFEDTLGLSQAELDAFRSKQGPIDDSHFTVRWMSSQNQDTRHHELGYWSWMDGVSDPTITYNDGIAESVTVTPAYFNALGWTGPLAQGRQGGTIYLETFKQALKHRPRVVHLHQFNEFSGQMEGHGRGPNRDNYTDTYSVELSDDLEPVSLTAPGYRGDNGGWGFYYLNLTQALMDLYRHTANDCTIIAVSKPVRNAVVTNDVLEIVWNSIGATVAEYEIEIDGELIESRVTGQTKQISLTRFVPGQHILTLRARGAVTRYPLSYTEVDTILEEPMPVSVDVPFVIA